MTSAASPPKALDPAKARSRLRGSSMGALTMLVLQFVLGVGVNLYISPAKGGVGEAFSNGPLLAIHAVLGLLLIIAAIDLLVRAIRAHHRPVTVVSAIGLLAIIGAASNGISFLSSQQNGPSLGMTVATGVAILCYGLALRFLSSP